MKAHDCFLVENGYLYLFINRNIDFSGCVLFLINFDTLLIYVKSTDIGDTYTKSLPH